MNNLQTSRTGADINYSRVMPRDLFNESKLLKCVGRLCLLIHDKLTPVPMSFDDEIESFQIGLMDEGSLTVDNLAIFIGEYSYIFKTTYNSKSNYPLFVQYDYIDYLVFNESGEFTEEFIEFAKDQAENWG